jgi:hypothetical protein
MQLFLFLPLFLTLVSCGSGKDVAQQVNPSADTNQELDPASNNNPPQGLNPDNGLQQKPITHIFIIPGFAYDAADKMGALVKNKFNYFIMQIFGRMFGPGIDGGLLLWTDKMKVYQQMVQQVAPGVQVVTLQYNYMGAPEVLKQDISNGIRRHIANNPNARFDLITHSLGGFAGIYGVIDTDLAPRLRRYVGHSGILFGWTPVGVAKMPCLTLKACGATHPLIIPKMSPFIQAFINRNKEKFRSIETCSIQGQNDGFVQTRDSFVTQSDLVAKAINKEVANLPHLKVLERPAFDFMLQTCYGSRQIQ